MAGTEIVKALIKARKNFKQVTFDKQGQRNKYATLKSILSAVDRALMDEGILFTQSELVGKDFPEPLLETKLIHTSGEFISSIAPISNDAKSPITNENQRYGAALSYARRYSAMTILGLYADDIDIDDHEYIQEDMQRGSTMQNKSSSSLTDKQLGFLKRLIKQKNDPKAMYDVVLRKYKIEKLEDLQSKDASDAIKMLQINP